MNKLVIQRLGSIRDILTAGHRGGAGMSAATVGREREEFVQTFLQQVLPSPFRVGTGDITDSTGGQSGQLDTVVEFPFMPSLPLMAGAAPPRLYFAEGVACVVEVKSNLATQWSDVLATAAKLRPLVRNFNATMSMGQEPTPHVPLFAVGYTGWSTIATLQGHVQGSDVDAALVIDPGLFVYPDGRLQAGADACMLAFLEVLHQSISALKAAGTSLMPYLG